MTTPVPSRAELANALLSDLAIRAVKANDDVWVVMPAYNEARVIESVVRGVRAVYPHVVVVDDGSRDETQRLAAAGGAWALRHVINRGQGAALQTGIEYALLQGAEFIITFDSDGQHTVEDIAALLAPLREGRADIALGSRFLGRTVTVPFARRCLLKAAVLFTRLVSGVRLTDTHNGLRGFTRRAAARLQIRIDRMAHASEIIDQIREMGLPYVEVPVHVQYTEYSMNKGQRATDAVRVALEYLVGRWMS